MFAQFVFSIRRSPVTTKLGKNLEHKKNCPPNENVNWI